MLHPNMPGRAPIPDPGPQSQSPPNESPNGQDESINAPSIASSVPPTQSVKAPALRATNNAPAKALPTKKAPAKAVAKKAPAKDVATKNLSKLWRKKHLLKLRQRKRLQ